MLLWQTVSIRMSLLRNFVGVIILLALGILFTTIFAARSAVTSLSESVMNVSIELTENRLREFFEPVTQELLVSKHWCESGLADRDNYDGLLRLVLPVLQQHGQISSMIIADENGREFMLMRNDVGFASRQTNVPEWGTRTLWHTWSVGEQPVEEWRELDYDPRKRPWFEGAFERYKIATTASVSPTDRDLVHWTSPYIFFTSKQPGITTSTVFTMPDGRKGVVALDIHLSSISEYTESLEVTPNGGVIVLTQDTRVVGLPPEEMFRDKDVRRAALLRQPEELGLQIVLDATPAFREYAKSTERNAVQFESGGKTWWGKGSPFVLGPDQLLRVGVVVPESDIIANLSTLRLWIIGVTTLVLLAAIVRAIVLARWFGKPIEQLVRQSDDISQGDLDDHDPITSPVLEVQALAEAQDHMRTALRSLLKFESDMQLARQIQQRTFPDKLPKVDGYQIGAAAQPADETGGDSYDVIGYSVTSTHSDSTYDGIELKNDNPQFVALMLADATGHGIGPALAVSQYRSMVRMAFRMGRHLREMAREINEQLCNDLPSGRFITAWIAVLDRDKHKLHSFSAGHAPLFHYIAAKNECHVMEADTMPFGITRQLPIEVPNQIDMARGDFFLVFSDGIFEMPNADGEQYGKERLIQLIKRERNSSPEAMLKALRKELNQFTGGAHPVDDCTAVILKRT